MKWFSIISFPQFQTCFSEFLRGRYLSSISQLTVRLKSFWSKYQCFFFRCVRFVMVQKRRNVLMVSTNIDNKTFILRNHQIDCTSHVLNQKLLTLGESLNSENNITVLCIGLLIAKNPKTANIFFSRISNSHLSWTTALISVINVSIKSYSPLANHLIEKILTQFCRMNFNFPKIAEKCFQFRFILTFKLIFLDKNKLDYCR